jgi:hypothetical protein
VNATGSPKSRVDKQKVLRRIPQEVGVMKYLEGPRRSKLQMYWKCMEYLECLEDAS